MNSSELLSNLKIPKTKSNISHATRLLAIQALLKSIKPQIIEAKIITEKTTVAFGRTSETRRDYRGNETVHLTSEGSLLTANEIHVRTATGQYNFKVPVNCEFYNEIAAMLKISNTFTPASSPEITETFCIGFDVIGKIKTAAKFTGKDDLRPVFSTVLISIADGMAEVAGTDATKLYMSGKIQATTNSSKQLLISPESLAAISKINTPVFSDQNNVYGKFARFDILEPDETGEQFMLVNGVKIKLYTSHEYPNYKSVIPAKTNKITFERDTFISTVRQVMPSANKTSQLVKFNFNGIITISAQDLDYNLASIARMNYIKGKRPPENSQSITIGLNGQRIQDCLKAFKEPEIDMYLGEHAWQQYPILISNNTDTVLLCQLQIDQPEPEPTTIHSQPEPEPVPVPEPEPEPVTSGNDCPPSSPKGDERSGGGSPVPKPATRNPKPPTTIPQVKRRLIPRRKLTVIWSN